MSSTNSATHYDAGILDSLDVDSQFLGLQDQSDSRIDLLMHQIRRLPVHFNEEFRFIDYDNTLSDDEWRFVICPELRKNRGSKAYPVIREKFGNGKSNGFQEYVDVLNPSEHLLDYSHFFDPSNPNHIILTASEEEELQTLKIEKSGFGNSERIIVDDAEKKIVAIIEFIIKRGYIPRVITFIDDKITNFIGKDAQLARILGIEVNFYKAIPNEDKSVTLENITRKTQTKVENLLRA